jgi:hypothetical protein
VIRGPRVRAGMAWGHVKVDQQRMQFVVCAGMPVLLRVAILESSARYPSGPRERSAKSLS